MKTWKTYWTNNKDMLRKRAPLLLFIFIYIFIFWLPIHYSVKNSREEIMRQDASSQKTLHMIAEIKRMSAQAPVLNTNKGVGSLLTLVDTAIQTNSLQTLASDLKQMEDNKVSVNFNKIDFDDLITWLEFIWKKNEIAVQRLSAESIPDSGAVRANIVFQK